MSTELDSVDLSTRLLVGSLCTVVFELFCGHILEVFKIKRQTTELSLAEIYEVLTATKGVVGIWDGFLPWGILMAASKGASFAFGQALFYKVLATYSGLTNATLLLLVSSALGGFFQGIFMSPLLLLKTRVVTHEKFRKLKGGVCESVAASLRIAGEVLGESGPFGLCKGMDLFAFKRLCDWLTRYFFVEVLLHATVAFGGDESLRKQFAVAFWCAVGGGTLSSLSTTLLDSLVSRSQESKAAQKSTAQLLKDSKNGQWKKGVSLRICHVALTTVLMKNVVPHMCLVCTRLFAAAPIQQIVAKSDL